MFHNFIRFAIIVAVLFLTSCIPLILGTTAATVAVVSMQERTVGNIIDDKSIWIKIKKALSTQGLDKGVSVSVNEGRVLLTGMVHNSIERIRVVKVIWEQNGVREVMNELKVEEREQSFAASSWITAQVRLALLMKSSVRSFNYTIETHDGTVYLLGIAQSNDELKKVQTIARKTKGVKRVVSYVRSKNNPMRFM